MTLHSTNHILKSFLYKIFVKWTKWEKTLAKAFSLYSSILFLLEITIWFTQELALNPNETPLLSLIPFLLRYWLFFSLKVELLHKHLVEMRLEQVLGKETLETMTDPEVNIYTGVGSRQGNLGDNDGPWGKHIYWSRY